jgi:NADPH:quinone reductase-like Zn-dependent oxidoreductase
MVPSMRAAVSSELGTLPAFADFNEPDAGDGHEVLEVLLAGLNPVDLYIAAGMYGEVTLPCVAGLEGIARLADGGHVYFNAPPKPFGSMAQFAPVDVASTFAVPEGLDDGLAVSLGIAGLAAWLPLTWRANLQAGETVLVLGASGVVGQIGVQAAKLLGAGRVVAAARSRAVLERLRERGADEIVVLEGDYAAALKDAAGDGYDVVLDPVYGPPLEAALAATALGARIVTVGAGAGMTVTVPMTAIYGRTWVGHSNGQAPLDVRREAYQRMAGHALAGEIVVDVERLPLSGVEEAWQRQAQGPHHKITLVP